MGGVHPCDSLGGRIVDALNVRHVAIESILSVRLVRAVESPHLVGLLASGPLEHEGVFTLTNTKQGLRWHENAKTDATVDTAPEGASLALRNLAVDIAALSLRDLLLERGDVPVLLVSAVHAWSTYCGLRLVVESVLRVQSVSQELFRATGLDVILLKSETI